MTGVISKFHNALLDGGWLFVSPTEIAHRAFEGFSCRRFPGAFVFRKGHWDDEKAGVWPGPADPAPLKTVRAAVRPVAAPAVPDYPVSTPLLRTIHGQEGTDSAEGRETPPADRYLEAVALYNEGHYELAAAGIREFLAAGQNSADAQELLAKTYANLGKFAEARKCCEDAVAADKLRAHNHYLLSIILLELGELIEAEASLKRALYINQDYVLAHFALGNLNRREGRKKESLRNFGNALLLLERRDPHEVLPEAEGMTAGRLAEIIRAMTMQESLVNDR
jgi:chemotaxis protein methyltransferase CheR